MPITITGVNTSLDQLDDGVASNIERELRERSLRALADVTLATPVDTGRARNSWYIGYTTRFIGNGSLGSITVLMPRDRPQEIIVTNGTTYIQLLNQGSSIQAGTMFIEQAFLRYFDEVRVEVINN